MAAMRVIPILIIIASTIIWSANAAPKQDIDDIVTNAYLGAIGDPEEKEIIDELMKKNRGLPHDIKQYLYVDPIISTQTVMVHVRDNSPKYRGSVKVYFNELNLGKTNGDLIPLYNNYDRKTKIADNIIIEAFITKNKLPDLLGKVKLVPDPSKKAPKTQARLVWKKDNTYIVPGDVATQLIGFAVVNW